MIGLKVLRRFSTEAQMRISFEMDIFEGSPFEHWSDNEIGQSFMTYLAPHLVDLVDDQDLVRNFQLEYDVFVTSATPTTEGAPSQ